MFSKKRKILFWIYISILSLIYLYLKFKGPLVVEYLYFNEQTEFLNTLVQIPAAAEYPLGFYVGRINDVVLGPACSVIASLIFIPICLLYFKTEKKGQTPFFLAVFLFLLLTKSEVLFYPVYGDPSTGPWIEGIWLKQNHFDYVGLFHQPEYSIGGPKNEFFNIHGGYFALMLTLIPWPKIFLLVHHLLYFFYSALIVAIFRYFFLQIGASSGVSILSSLILLSLPLYQSMTEILNLEIPCLFFTMLSFC